MVKMRTVAVIAAAALGFGQYCWPIGILLGVIAVVLFTVSFVRVFCGT